MDDALISGPACCSIVSRTTLLCGCPQSHTAEDLRHHQALLERIDGKRKVSHTAFV